MDTASIARRRRATLTASPSSGVADGGYDFTGTATGLRPGTNFVFDVGGLDGGGFPNVADWDPNNLDIAYLGADIGGTYISYDRGRSYSVKARGTYADSHKKAAGLAAFDMGAGATRAVLATGFKGAAGGLLYSDDRGDNWTVGTKAHTFSAQNSDVFLPEPRPRCTGRVVAQGADGSYYSATYKAGLYRTGDPNSAGTRIAFNPTGNQAYLYGVIPHPTTAGTVYALAYGDTSGGQGANGGVYKITNAATAGVDGATMTKVSTGVNAAMDAVFIDGTLYVACGKKGVWRYVQSTSTWTDITGSLPVDNGTSTTSVSTGLYWCAIDGYVSGGAVTLYAAAAAPQKGTGSPVGRGRVYLSRNGSGATPTWTNTVATGVTTVPYGRTATWWVTDDHPSWGLNGNACDIASIRVHPTDRGTTTDRVLVTATSGAWLTENSGANWKPAVKGFAITTYRDAAQDPTSTARSGVGSTDHDGFVVDTIPVPVAFRNFNGVNTVAHAVAYSSVGEFAFASNERDFNADGSVHLTTAAQARGTATAPSASASDTGYSAAAAVPASTAGTGKKRPCGLEIVTLAGGNRRIVAAIDGGGVVYRDYSAPGTWVGAWTAATVSGTGTLMGAQVNSGLRCSVLAPAHGSVVYLYDRASGVWRSTNYGAAWTRIWSKVSNVAGTAYLAAYSTNPGNLYIATSDGLYRMVSANTGTPAAPTQLLAGSDVGPVARTDTGDLVVYRLPGAGRPAQIRHFTAPASLTAWADGVDVGDDSVRDAAATPNDLDASSTLIVIATDGNGVIYSDTWGL